MANENLRFTNQFTQSGGAFGCFSVAAFLLGIGVLAITVGADGFGVGIGIVFFMVGLLPLALGVRAVQQRSRYGAMPLELDAIPDPWTTSSSLA